MTDPRRFHDPNTGQAWSLAAARASRRSQKRHRRWKKSRQRRRHLYPAALMFFTLFAMVLYIHAH